jgi:NitT/TauT family transport system permease protein
MSAGASPPMQRSVGISRFLLGFVPFAAVAVIWTVLVDGVRIPEVFLPSLGAMPGVLWNMFAREGIGRDILISSYRVLGGFILAVMLATPLGLMMGYSRSVGRLFEPIVGFVRYIPVPVFIPLTILWLQSGNIQKMAVIFLGAFFQLVLMVRDAAGSVPKDYFEAAIMRCTPRRHLVTKVLWPAALPKVFDSYRICIGWAWTYLVVAEIVGANTGVGYYIIKAQRYLMIPQIFAAMFLIGLLGMATDLLFAAAYGRLFPWAPRSSSQQRD